MLARDQPPTTPAVDSDLTLPAAQGSDVQHQVTQKTK